ncbi:hypothetical protein P171DRAFT_133595 [Karstenula rhodostoma CBS 690.94]|uniref:HNH nuclease domain-containing protein n=1 Tax=Karstenula rhodostoma CBS 690.94 TaxID=1392251 RepID=A0A9P4P9N5_9PLEO|nr:hypothetical protein P171DRAFT_133595 [Karstenula rhodostoma CBS 690.94]
MSRAPLHGNGEPPLSLPYAQPPATPDVPSLVPDIDASINTVSPAPPPQSSLSAHNTEPEFRRPTAPSSIASHRRKRANDDDAVSRTSSPAKKSKVSESTFTNSYKEQLQTYYGGCCACEVRYYLHAAHVIDKAVGPDLSKLQRQGLVSLRTLGDFENAIYLCPADHAAFDARDPGLIIVPTYFDFFIDHERRWQQEMQKTTPPRVRIPVLPNQYAAYCAEISGEEETKGRYTAYMVVDYKEEGRIGPPRMLEWHGDPGAILWKARCLAVLQLGSLEPEPAHLLQLIAVKKQLRYLTDLQEAGDLEWKSRSNACAARDHPAGGGPPPAGPSNYGGNSDQGDRTRDNQLPQPPSSGSPGAAGLHPYNPPFWNTLSLQKDTGVYPQICGTKRKQADLGFSDDSERAKPIGRTGASLPRPPESRRQAYRWGGSTSSTEENVRYWNAVFGDTSRTRETL